MDDLLRALPGVGIDRRYAAYSTRRPGPVFSGLCWMQVVFDGIVIYQIGDGRGPPDLRRDFLVWDIESIEIYRSAAETPIGG